MSTFDIFFALLMLGAFLCLWRLGKGPTAPDRTVAVDTLTTLVIGFCALYALRTDASYYMNIAIAWALLSFVGAIALAKTWRAKPSMNEQIGYIIIGIGVAFDVFGTIGLVRLPDVYNRLQAATKCVTLGTCLILIGVAVFAGTGEMISKAILCVAFVLLTSPVGAHALARGAHLGGVKLWDGSVVDKYDQR